MYKRKFSVPLHKNAATAAATAAPDAAAQQASAQHAERSRLGSEQLKDDSESNKENTEPCLPLPAPKKAKAFVAPGSALTSGAVPSSQPRQQQQQQQEAQRAGTAPVALRTFSVLYTKREKAAKKKDKGYQDGIIQVGDKGCTLLDMEGKVVTRGKARLPARLESGTTFELGNFVLEYDQEVAPEDFKHGKCFTDACKLAGPGAAGSSSGLSLALKPAAGAAAKPNHLASRKPNHLAGRHGGGGGGGGPAPLFDPSAPGAIVLQHGQGLLPSGRPAVAVVVDPYVGRALRPHQREGVAFMYECCMGLKDSRHSGCLLADEMGLGKTLQVIALLWTLLRQGPEGMPVCNKAIVVAPATLVANWGREVKKWLGVERLKFMQLAQGPTAAEQVNDFKLGKVWRLLIASYEGLRKYGSQLQGCCDVLVCDEGHRLKSTGGNQTISALLELGCSKRIVLTGTPVQNNLSELYALLSFACPGILGSPAVFKRVYGDPITRSRDKDASAADQELGTARAEALKQELATFVLRRTQEVLSKHLPPLAVHTIFCKPSALQLEVYRGVLSSQRFASLLYGKGGGDSEGVLPAISLLRKLCNHPKLLVPDGVPQGRGDAGQQGLGQQPRLADVAAAVLGQHLAAAGGSIDAVELSGKLHTLSALLQAVVSEGGRMVVVSTSTAALDLIDTLLCQPNGWHSVRIDGGTSIDERQVTVDNFNQRGVGKVFLLSTRAGGAGLNLIGANHLLLYDSDWNPAMDKQAMARIWRDGQQKPCFVHRLLTTGSIEEKVYQRQIVKTDLADATMAAGASVAGDLSHNDLKELFKLDTGYDSCSTQQLLDACQAGNSITWLSLPGQGGGSSSSSLPSVLAAAVAAGAVTAINREDSAGDAAASTGQAAAGVAAGAAAQQQQQQQTNTLDVDCLEVDDD